MNFKQHLLSGLVIPAHPLALTPARDLDERHQRGLTRYYVAAGAGGMAVGVHTTQFEIREAGPLLTRNGCAAPEIIQAEGTTLVRVTWAGRAQVGWRDAGAPGRARRPRPPAGRRGRPGGATRRRT